MKTFETRQESHKIVSGHFFSLTSIKKNEIVVTLAVKTK